MYVFIFSRVFFTALSHLLFGLSFLVCVYLNAKMSEYAMQNKRQRKEQY